MRQTGRKLKRLIETEERLVSRIFQLQEELKIVRESRKKEEELEMVRTLRSLKLGGRDLFNLLEGIQDGSVSLEKRDLPETDAQDGQESGEQASAEEEKETGNDTVKCIALASAILACIVLITRPLSEYAECW